jgi:beta-galactosidase
VPIFACAGQGSPSRASVPGLPTAFNIYCDAKDPGLEEVCLATREHAGESGYPLLISETQRDQFMLRRELSCGARLVGPYNQVGGTNFGFTNGLNNWGAGDSPLSFVASNYDFSSLISAAGEIRGVWGESRLIAELIESLGESLAAAVVERNHGYSVKADFPMPATGAIALRLAHGGLLLCAPNIGDAAGCVSIEGHGVGSSAYVGPGEAPFFPIGIPLHDFGFEGILLWSSAEIGGIKREGSQIVFHLYSERGGSAVLRVPGAETVEGTSMKDGLLRLEPGAESAILSVGEKKISISLTDRVSAAYASRG